MRTSRGELVAGALTGYVASRTMDQATTWFRERQTAASIRREDELAPGGALVVLGRQLGTAFGRDLDDAAAGRIGLAVHRALGAGYGAAASLLVRRGIRPLTAGMIVGTTAFLVVDEGTAIAQFRDYPVESHLRGVVGHGALGLVIGFLQTLLEQ